MKKIIIAIVIGILTAAVGTGIYFVTADKNDGTVSVTVDDFVDSPDTLESLMTRPEIYTKVLENQYHLGAEKTAEFYEYPEEWLTYTEFLTVTNSTDETITVFALDVSDNGKDGVYICTSLEGDIEIEPGNTAPVLALGFTSSRTRRNSRWAVWPMIWIARSASVMPGSCTCT